MALGFIDDAIEIFHDALGIFDYSQPKQDSKESVYRYKLGKEKIYNHIGSAYFKSGDFQEAQESFNTAFNIQKTIIERDMLVLSPVQLMIASTRRNLGYLHIEKNEWNEAVTQFQEALKTQVLFLNPGNSLILSTKDSLAYAYMMRGSHEEALLVSF